MYTKPEASELRREFWTAFGVYMRPVLSAEGEKATWMNYKTGEKEVYFKMEAGSHKATISIEISHADVGLQKVYFEQFKNLIKLFQGALGEEWNWQLHTTNEFGKTVSVIYKDSPNVSIYNKEDWPTIISFFKPRIIALDSFWSEAKYAFQTLR